MSFLNNIIDFFEGAGFQGVVGTVRNIFLIADAVLIIIILGLVMRALEFRPDFVFPKKQKKKRSLKQSEVKERWEGIVKKSETAPPHSLTLAIIEADSFIDNILKSNGIPGEHMADRLEQLGSENLRTLEKLWQAHRIRNDLVHTPGFDLKEADARRVLKDYEAFLKEYGAM